MVKLINSWAQGIVLAVIIATIIEIILPEGNNKKYVKTILGIYILFAIIYPLLTKISSKNININSIIDKTNKEINKYETDNTLVLETNSYIQNAYQVNIEEDIKRKVEEKGYNINFLNVNIETQNQEIYGQINNINMNITKKIKEKDDSNNMINQINKIEINIGKNDIAENNSNINKEININEIQTLKEYLSSVYGIEKEGIHINE
ncbi:MAG: stage III sporulation protein AF [Clostridia bacterium]|nr:stage III sporulation protein AF [Clostridia bacterium]